MCLARHISQKIDNKKWSLGTKITLQNITKRFHISVPQKIIGNIFCSVSMCYNKIRHFQNTQYSQQKCSFHLRPIGALSIFHTFFYRILAMNFTSECVLGLQDKISKNCSQLNMRHCLKCLRPRFASSGFMAMSPRYCSRGILVPTLDPVSSIFFQYPGILNEF